MATRVTSPSDQKRTEVTLLGELTLAPAHSAAAATNAVILLRSEIQPAILVGVLLQLGMLRGRRRCGYGLGRLHRGLCLRLCRRFGVRIALAHLRHVIL